MQIPIEHTSLEKLDSFDYALMKVTPYEDIIIMFYDNKSSIPLEEIHNIYKYICNQFPENKVIGLPKDINIITTTQKDGLIKWLNE